MVQTQYIRASCEAQTKAEKRSAPRQWEENVFPSKGKGFHDLVYF